MWKNYLKPAGKGSDGKNPALLNNQCSGLDELDSVASIYPVSRKISDFKTRADRAF